MTRKAIPADAIPLHEAYWQAVRTLFPFMNAPPSGTERMWKATLKTRRALKEFDKRWRLSLAGCDPMTGEQTAVMLPSFVIHPETLERLNCTENWKWLDPNEEIRVERTLPVRTANGEIDCTVLTDLKAFEQWLNVMPERFPRNLGVSLAPKPQTPIAQKSEKRQLSDKAIKEWLRKNVNRSQPKLHWFGEIQRVHPEHRISKRRQFDQAWKTVPKSQRLSRGERRHEKT